MLVYPWKLLERHREWEGPGEEVSSGVDWAGLALRLVLARTRLRGETWDARQQKWGMAVEREGIECLVMCAASSKN